MMNVTLVDRIANAMPVAGSLIPAAMTIQSVKRLGFEDWQTWVIGIVVEGLGFVTVTTTVDIYEAQMGAVQAEKAPGLFWVSMAATGVYAGVIVLINAVLHDGDMTQKITLGMLSLFGLLGGLMAALRNQLGKWLASRAQAQQDAQQRQQKADEEALARQREEAAAQERLRETELRLKTEAEIAKIESDNRRKVAIAEAKLNHPAPENTTQAPESDKKAPENDQHVPEMPRRWAEITSDERRWIADAPVNEIIKRFALSGKDPERKARDWKAKAGGA